MPIRLLTSVDDLDRYDRWVRGHIEGTLWQSLAWRAYQEALGRQARIYVLEKDERIRASALVSIDRTSFGLSTWNIARGPLLADAGVGLDDAGQLIDRLCRDAAADRCITVFASPCHAFDAALVRAGFRASGRHEQPEASLIVDLRASDEEILGRMHPKGRYNIKLALKNGVTTKETRDVASFFALVEETAKRDGFRHPSRKTYESFLTHLEGSFLLLAYAPTQKKPIAGLMGVIWNGTGIYYYGASSQAYRVLMAPSLLQWEAMRLCKARSSHAYDLFGIAPPEARNHAWSGVTDFKRKFGGKTVIYPPERKLTLRRIASGLLTLKRKLAG